MSGGSPRPLGQLVRAVGPPHNGPRSRHHRREPPGGRGVVARRRPDGSRHRQGVRIGGADEMVGHIPKPEQCRVRQRERQEDGGSGSGAEQRIPPIDPPGTPDRSDPEEAVLLD